MTITPGQSLTPEQVRNLPDGAVVSAVWNYDSQRAFCTVGSNDALGVPKKFGGSTLEHEDYWNYDQWHSVRLESMPEPDKDRPVLCDRCGTTYKNNERHACVAREPSESSPGEGYRWVEIGERLITGDQRESSRGAGDWFADNLPGVSCQDVHCYRRRIEPQAEPAKPERPVYVSTCDRCGTTYKNNERHACAPKKYTQSDLLRGVTMEKHGAEIEQMPDYTPPQPELDSDYRWVNIGERIIGTDEYLTGYGEWMQTGGLEFKCTVAKKYRRRIEPQAEPAKPERQASEIEKRAAVALLENCKSSIVERVDSGFNASLRISCEWYIEAYDYAKSIGAIE